MPIGKRKNQHDEEVQYYYYGMLPAPHDDAPALIRSIKKQAAQDMDEYSILQKDAAKVKDFEMAKYWSKCKAESQKWQKACTFVLPWYDGGELPGDSKKVVDIDDWPCELDEQLTSILNRLKLRIVKLFDAADLKRQCVSSYRRRKKKMYTLRHFIFKRLFNR